MIIGFAGKAAAGKTTAANFLAEILTQEVLIVPMAMVLRDEVERFLRSVGGDEFVPLVYGCQEDKVRVFTVDSERARAVCEQWDHFIAEHQDIQVLQGRAERTALTVRRLLQWWGTEYRRAQDPDYWTKAWNAKVASYDLSRTHLLIDDVRFANELATIKALGGLIVKIERPGCDGANNHSSETALDTFAGWDATIVNDGTLSQLHDKLVQFAATT